MSQHRSVESIESHITLQMLKCVLELTRTPREFENFALPSLIAGSIVLMSFVRPMPFAYEYGYLCFRILVFSLNTCLIEYGHNLDFILGRMYNGPEGTHLSFFWEGAADFIAGELSTVIHEKRLTHILNPGPQRLPLLERPMLDKLLKVLHADRKNFLVVLMSADSLQLSGLMFVLWKYLEIEERTQGKSDFTQNLFLPYCRIFRRYRLLFSETNHETELTRLIYDRVSRISGIQDKDIIDIEDSRNVIRAYNRSMGSSQRISCNDAIHYMGFVAPLFIPGCQDLVPSMVKSTFQMLWKTWPKSHIENSMAVIQAYGVCFWNLCIEHLQPMSLYSKPENWRFELVDAIMESDFLELTFRVALQLSESQAHGMERARPLVNKFFEEMISFWEATVLYTPKDYFERRLIESGVIAMWFKCFVDFNERLCARASSSTQGIILPFSMIFSRAVTAVLGSKWRDMQSDFQATGTLYEYSVL
ncbi:unnamed protein product [Rhizoctonia solani]|uniref:Uncharacterized protein n=1 Tax=Rhizoctonia solani TaxID=456999 RepID=A0A8H3BZ81_9AGAM|nr:unnamed protein product [Rhizoctonia solani]